MRYILNEFECNEISNDNLWTNIFSMNKASILHKIYSLLAHIKHSSFGLIHFQQHKS